jgi:hypothetical protein
LTETVTVLPEAETDNQGVAGEVVTVIDPGAPVICSVCGGGLLPGEVENVRNNGFDVTTCAAVTIKVTGTATTLFAAPDDETRTVPW